MRHLPLVLVCASILLVLGWSSDGPTTKSEAEVVEPLPAGCGLDEVQSLYEGFLSAVNSGNGSATLQYISGQPEQNGFLFADSGSGREWSSQKPARVARYLVRQAHLGQRLQLLGAGVEGINPGVGPRAGPYHRPAGGPAADDAVAAVGAELKASGGPQAFWQPAGKAGVNCETGQFYIWAMDMGRSPGASSICNGQTLDARKPPKRPRMCRLG